MEHIQDASPNAVRAVLLALCEDEGVMNRVMEHLHVVEHLEKLQGGPEKRTRVFLGPDSALATPNKKTKKTPFVKRQPVSQRRRMMPYLPTSSHRN